jgi:hypothetical protein
MTRDDIALILESLHFTKRKFEEYTDYPSYEFKQRRLKDVERAADAVRKLRLTLGERGRR